MLRNSTYGAFGEIEVRSGGTKNSYLFAGEQLDENLGEYYLRQRYYDTETGRFTRKDSYEGRLTKPESLHKYLYANASPINAIDPSGLTTASVSEQVFTMDLLSRLAATAYIMITVRIDPLGGIEGTRAPNSDHTGRDRDDLFQGAYDPLVNAPDIIRNVIQRAFAIYNSAAVNLPDLTGKARSEAERELQDAGFQDRGKTAGGYDKWYHPDGSRVQIDPEGRVKRSAPKTLSPTTGKMYRPRVNQDGQEIPHNPGGSEHDTGERIIP